jgi:uncharacterized membrane protein
MKEQWLVAEYATYQKAHIGLEVLDLRGFTADTVSLVSRNDASIAELEKARREKAAAPSKTASGGVGAAIAGAAAAPIAIGTMLGPLFLAGPLAAVVAGAAAGGLLSGTKKWGIDEDVARTYQQRIAQGSVLVIVHASGDTLKEAEAGLRTTDTLTLETLTVDQPSTDA